MLFEGLYSNGLRKGKGKEYGVSGLIEFEGEYNDGKRLKGKEYQYNDIGTLEFEGDYIEGQRWNGMAIQYDWDKEILFAEQIVNGNKI